MSNWYETADGLWQASWDTLSNGVADAAHPARRPTFATVSPNGWPEARTVVLRTADQQSVSVSVHTDLYSDKIESLRATPRAALHVWVADQNLQLRLQADVIIHSAPQTLPLWDDIPDHAQQSYGVTPSPGTPIKGALDYHKSPDPATFAVLECRLSHIDVVHLGQDHRRISYSRARHWAGQWLSP